MRYWILLSQYELLENYVPLAQLAEECGYAGILVPDHVVMPSSFDTTHPIKHPTVAENQFPDALTIIAAMSAATRTLEFATYVLVLPMRNPFLVAKQVATTAAITGYRLSLGVGVGWLSDEFELLGQPFSARGKRTDEMITIMKDLWDDGYAEFRGDHFSFDRVGMFPVPDRRIPVLVGGSGPAALRRAAGNDGAMPMNRSVEDAQQKLRTLQEERVKIGKAPLAGSALLAVGDMADIRAYQELESEGATDILVFPWSTQIPPEVATAKPAERRRQLEDYAKAVGL